MKEASGRTIGNTCMEIARQTGPVRSVSFELLSELMLLNQRKSKKDVEELDKLFDTFRTAKAMLDDGIVTLFRRIGTPVPENLEAARTQTCAIISDTAEQMDQLRILAERGEVEADHFADTGEDLRIRLIPSIAEFLQVLQNVRSDHEDTVTDESKEVVRSAVAKIDTIALSIRMISLNASVEAAHAGDAGRGFAVIAQEIQKLSDEAKTAIDYVRKRLA
jgi:Methyl-accepting chemotaxis protein (MCP) signalling domain